VLIGWFDNMYVHKENYQKFLVLLVNILENDNVSKVKFDAEFLLFCSMAIYTSDKKTSKFNKKTLFEIVKISNEKIEYINMKGSIEQHMERRENGQQILTMMIP